MRARFVLIPEARPDMSFHFSHSSSDTSSQRKVVAPTSASMAPSPADTADIGVSDIANIFQWCEMGSNLFRKEDLTAYFGISFQSYSRTQTSAWSMENLSACRGLERLVEIMST